MECMAMKNQEKKQGWTWRGFLEGELVILTISLNTFFQGFTGMCASHPAAKQPKGQLHWQDTGRMVEAKAWEKCSKHWNNHPGPELQTSRVHSALLSLFADRKMLN